MLGDASKLGEVPGDEAQGFTFRLLGGRREAHKPQDRRLIPPRVRHPTPEAR